jgi:hypothetical protein
MKISRIFALAAVGVMAVGALIGGAEGSSSAATATATLGGPGHLCVDLPNSLCIYSAGIWDAELAPPNYSGITNWVYPDTDQTQAIKQDMNNTCLQVDAGKFDDGGYIVRGAACDGDQAEMWVNQPDGDRTQFYSVFAKDTTTSGFGGKWCLSASTADLNASSVGGYLYIYPCSSGNAIQDWGTS